MAWAEPLYTKAMVAAAGKTLVDRNATAEDRELALTVTNNWRSSHAFPLNTLQINLRRVARNFEADPTVAQRIKRLSSIRSKLERLAWLSLDEMQDLGGCRAVLSGVPQVENVVRYYQETSSIRHELIDQDDYISNPKRSGYRGVHLIYSYVSDKKSTYTGLKIEMQIRSRLQHAWATSVETVGMFTSQALKSSAGEQKWLRFFALMSSMLALQEQRPTVPGTPKTADEIKPELEKLATTLRVVERLEHYAVALRVMEGDFIEPKMPFVVLELNTADFSLDWHQFANPAVAAESYNAIERAAAEKSAGIDVVLVRVDSMDALRRAYPNYFADTAVFLVEVQKAIM